ncbi:MAG: efflux RND transporter periplasmic adaptor subunit [Candidatus Eisenbacteria sp.]|nr:efflux RND transporter periplasmic adaptor subunit [Candidatus Eisenbacteria bacterium]
MIRIAKRTRRRLPPAGDLPRRGITRWALLLLPAAILIASGCGGDDSESGAADSTGAAADTTEATAATKEKAISVNAGLVRRGPLVGSVFADGVLRTARAVVVRTKASGELAEVLVDDGDRVRKGQLLARIDQRECALSLEESRYRHFQALSQVAAEGDTFTVNHAALRRFAEQRDELEAQHAAGDLSLEEHQARLLELELGALDEGAFRQQVFEKRTGLAEARLAEERAQLDLENTEIRAPFAGVVQGVTVVPGEIVALSTAICQVYDNRELEAVVHVLESDLGNLEVGRPVLLAIPATHDTLRATVDVISPFLDEASRTCEVLMQLGNAQGRLRPGMFLRAEIAGWVYPDRLMVPKVALLERDDRPLVFKVADSRAQWLYVDIGLANDHWVEIVRVHSGGSLAPGEQVVVSDHLTLAHEAKLKVRRVVAPLDRWNLGGYDLGQEP